MTSKNKVKVHIITYSEASAAEESAVMNAELEYYRGLAFDSRGRLEEIYDAAVAGQNIVLYRGTAQVEVQPIPKEVPDVQS
jgi:hypothetical protein